MSTGFDQTAVSELSHWPIPAGVKGFSVSRECEEITGATLAASGTTLFGGGLSFPLLAVRDTAVAHNIRQLARFTADREVLFAPHAKTTMAPQLFARQLEAGAWGLTAASISHVQVYRRFGVKRVLLANELVDPAAIGWLADELNADPGFEFYCYVDSEPAVALLDRYWRRRPGGRRLNVLVELGFPGGRTGCRTLEQAQHVAAAAAATSTLTVAGVSGYEGGLGDRREDAVLAAVRDWCAHLIELFTRLQRDGLEPTVISAGGSAFPDVVTEALTARPAEARFVLRSGAYVTHDHSMYAQVSPFTVDGACPEYALTPALELWARVLSRPEPALAILDFGRRDAGTERQLPMPLRLRREDGTSHAVSGWQVTRMNDQHAYCTVPVEAELGPGDLVSLGISHPCTTFDRWPHPVLVDDDDHVLDVLTTFF